MKAKLPSDLPLVSSSDSIRQAMTVIGRWAKGIALVVDQQGHLTDTITDGDVRRVVLESADLDQQVGTLLASKAGSSLTRPITAAAGVDRGTMLEMLQHYDIRHLPLVDEENRVVGLATLDDFVSDKTLPLHALIMAGGIGSRLRPLTEDMPKPMLPVGDQPLMEITIEGLQKAGIRHVHVSVHHQSDKIKDHFGDGKELGVEISYLTEDSPLGTAGALGMMELPQDTVLVINGDILTQVDFHQMLEFHREHGADLTVAVQRYQLQVPYGVIECEGPTVSALAEKPQLNFFINAGIYLIEPDVRRLVPTGERYDMPDLIQRVLTDGRSVAAFPIHEYWIDIGQHSDYQQAREYMENSKPGA